MNERRFIIDLDNVYRGTNQLALGTLSESPERPGVAHVTNVNGAHYVAVWSEGEHSNYWQLAKATPQQIAAYERAPRAQVERRPQPPAPVVVAEPPAPLAQTNPKRDWSTVLTLALDSGRLTDEQRTQALQLLATGGPRPTTKPPNPTKETQPVISSADIYEARRAGPASWDAAIAKMSNPQRDDSTLDVRAIYAARRSSESQKSSATQAKPKAETIPSASEVYAARRAVAASWDDVITAISNPQRM